jgi:hypothetical protein
VGRKASINGAKLCASENISAVQFHSHRYATSLCSQWILTRNFRELNKGNRGGSQVCLYVFVLGEEYEYLGPAKSLQIAGTE